MANFSINFTCRKCEGNIGKAEEQTEKLCDEVETVREFIYIGDSVTQMEDVSLLLLPEQDEGGVSLGNVVSCCMEKDFL